MDTLPEADQRKLREVFERFVTDAGALDRYFEGTPFAEALALDSLTTLHLITEIEKAFAVRFDLRTLEEDLGDSAALQRFLARREPAAS